MPSVFILIKQEEIPFSEEGINIIQDFPNVIRHGNYNDNKIIALEYLVHKTVYFPAQRVVGPKTDATQQAIEGFYKKWEKSGGRISIEENNYVFIKEAETKTAKEVAPEIIETILFTISKKWKETLDIAPLPWTRPPHSISAFLDGEEIQHKYSWYHSNEIKNFEELKKMLPQEVPFVIIENKINEIEKEYGITCVSRKSIDELAWLYEKPAFCLSKIPQEYLSLPKEIIKLTVAKNQRYILFEKAGKIVEDFLIVGKRHNKIIEQGHLRTLKARLEDARYYIEQDLKSFVVKKVSPSLEKIIFHEKYGSIAKRVQEMQILAEEIFPNNQTLQEIITVCKNDLNTNIVQSFTELQGYCGGYYLETLGEKKEISEAVAEHYKPLNPNDSLPSTELGAKLSLIDKLQKINALAEIGEIPTSSRDPFAIRRDILSIIRICVQFEIKIKLSERIHTKLQNFAQERINLYRETYPNEMNHHILQNL